MSPHPLIRRLLGGFALLIVISAPAASLAAPKADLWQRWTAHDAASSLRVDHGPWDTFLMRHVRVSKDRINRIDYAAALADDGESLQRYIDDLAGTAVSALNRGEQQAYWINLYNALTVRVVLDHYPVASIRDINISPGFFSSGPWGKKLVTVEGEKISLDDIEHRILRPIWKDARLHYALNCASLGCPNLQRRAFTPGDMDALLDQAARDYVNHRRGARIENGGLYVSSIYEWFKADFGATDRGVIDHLRAYAAPDLAARMKAVSGITDDGYNWKLNGP